MPLVHTAHAVAKDDVTFGAGFSGVTAPSRVLREGRDSDLELLEAAAVGTGLAPWVGARLGFGDGFDAGLSYFGRSARLDARRSLALSREVALSIGLGGSALLPHRREALAARVGGFGGDVPLLVGWRSAADIYSAWIGVRGGAEVLRGQREVASDPVSSVASSNEALEGWHSWLGGVVGLRVGFRHVFAVLEVDAAMNWASFEVAERRASLAAVGVTPAAALVARF